VQLDDCTWGMIVDNDYWKAKVGIGFTLEQEALQYLKVNNLAIEGKPEGLTINTHVCRGNYHSCYATKGAYDPVAPYLFAHENVDTFYLEYDDERSGGARIDYLQVASVGGQGYGHRPHQGGCPIYSFGAFESESSMWFRFLRDRQQADRGGAVG